VITAEADFFRRRAATGRSAQPQLLRGIGLAHLLVGHEIGKEAEPHSARS